MRLQLDWEIEDGTDLRDWISLKLGKVKAGGVSKLRQLLNALSDKPADTEVSFFDTETLEWGYDGADGPAHNQLVEGLEVIFLGEHGTKADGGNKFSIRKYKSPRKPARAAAAAPAGKPDHAAAARRKLTPSDDDEIPF